MEGLAKDGYSNQTVYDVITAYARSAAIDTFDSGAGIVLEQLHDDGRGGVLPEIEIDPPTAEALEAAITVCLRSPRGTRLDLRGVTISGRSLADLSTANLAAAHLVDCRFENGSLSDISFVGARIVRGRFKSLSLEDCRFEGAMLVECSLDAVTVIGTLLWGADFDRCHIGQIEVDKTSTAPPAELDQTECSERLDCYENAEESNA